MRGITVLNKHPLIPNIRQSSEKVYKFSEEAKICNTCNLPDSKCSYRCKRHKEELAKLKKGGNIVGNDKPD